MEWMDGMDEWMGWIAEKGGFLDMDSDTELMGNIIHNMNRPEGSSGTGLLADPMTY